MRLLTTSKKKNDESSSTVDGVWRSSTVVFPLVVVAILTFVKETITLEEIDLVQRVLSCITSGATLSDIWR